METKNIPNLHVLTVNYKGATDFQSSHIIIRSDRFRQSIIIPFDYALNNIEAMALPVLTARGFNIVGIAEGYVITDTFQPLKV